MKKLALTLGLVAAVFAAAVRADDAPYRDGPVTLVTSVKIKPGKQDEYLRYLAGSYKAQLEAQVKAGYVLRWGVYTATARTPHDPDMYLTVTYPNMATLDKNDEMQAVISKIAGTLQEMNKGFAERGSLREILGAELIREQIFK